MYKVPLFSRIPAFAHWHQVKENNSFKIIINFQLFQQKSQGLKPIKKGRKITEYLPAFLMELDYPKSPQPKEAVHKTAKATTAISHISSLAIFIYLLLEVCIN